MVTEKLGCVRPGRTKYSTLGACPVIIVETHMTPSIPVCDLSRLAISIMPSSFDNSSAKSVSAGRRAISSSFIELSHSLYVLDPIGFTPRVCRPPSLPRQCPAVTPRVGARKQHAGRGVAADDLDA